ncbi:hypothetical protein [Pararhodobacter oceanensis]|uniref:hypothetical protein n=1 Tax=Pararhodobacter oceanensis TaxID=2172121 RepID=UPI003A8EFF0E
MLKSGFDSIGPALFVAASIGALLPNMATACVPRLVMPAELAIITLVPDGDGRVSSEINFAWRGCAEATRYHLYAIGMNAFNPIINERELTSATYRYRGTFHPGGETNWLWKVRAYADGEWGEWSSIRVWQQFSE